MNRQRLIILIIAIAGFVSYGAWLVYGQVRLSQNTFLSGKPPQDVSSMVLPQDIALSKLRPPALAPTDQIRFGSASSVASVIEFGDYECETCKQNDPIIMSVIQAYGGRIRFVWRDFPVWEKNPNALEAAVYARCAGLLGNKFWEAHDALMNTANFSEAVFDSISEDLGLDVRGMYACRKDQKLTDAIRQEVLLDRNDGINKVPLLFVGTTAHEGPITADELDKLIKQFLNS